MENIKIIVVDDEPSPREVIRRCLEEAKYHVTVAENAEVALDKMKKTKFDIAFIDIVMPGMNGFELMRKIREEKSDIIMIVITGYAGVNSAVEAIKLVADDYIAKPFLDINSIVSTVSRNLERRRIKNFIKEINSLLIDINANISILNTVDTGKLSPKQKKIIDDVEKRIKEVLEKTDKLSK